MQFDVLIPLYSKYWQIVLTLQYWRIHNLFDFSGCNARKWQFLNISYLFIYSIYMAAYHKQVTQN